MRPPLGAFSLVSPCDSSAPVMPAARLVITEKAAQSRPRKRPRIISGHRRHADGVRAHAARHADFGRRLEAWAGKPHVDAFMQGDARRFRRAAEDLHHACVIGIGEADEARIAGLADQRVCPGEIDVVGDHHHRTGAHLRPQRPGRIGEYQPLDADGLHDLQRPAHGGRIAFFVIVRPPRKQDHRHAGKVARRKLAGMPADGGMRETFQFEIRHAHRLFEHGRPARRGPSPARLRSVAAFRPAHAANVRSRGS